MNEKLSTSGGNVIAIVVLLFIGYTTFLQLCNHADYNIGTSFILSALIILCVTLLFGGLQILKSTDKKFKQRIQIEKILLLSSPALCFGLMQPFIQFWNVQRNSVEIEETYKNATDYTIRIFNEYDEYATKRIQNYDNLLERIIRNKNVRPNDFRVCGFTGVNDDIKKKNKVKMLRTQLLSNNYKQLRESAIKWSRTNHKASVWNFFMQANLAELNHAITLWHKELVKLSTKKLSDEEFRNYTTVEAFDAHDGLYKSVIKELDAVNKNISQQKGQSAKGLFFSTIAYILLLLPYIVVRRNQKSMYHLFCTEKVNTGIHMDDNGTHRQPQQNNQKNEDGILMMDMDDNKRNTTDSVTDDDDITICMNDDEEDSVTSRRKRRVRKSPNRIIDEDNNDNSFTL